MRCLWFWGDFGQPVSWSSGLCSFVAGEFAWYVLPWYLLALVWCLVSVYVWRHLMSSCQLMIPGVGSSLESGFGLKPPASSYRLIFTVVSKLLLLYSTIDKTSQGFNLLPVASKAVPSVIASSVCWSLQCLVSALTQRGWWWTLFFFFFFRLTCSVALWGGRDAANK